ncbi:MAG TPA: hypothetical protein VKC54_01565 [Patescibacteria group bacterium]|nr:hypothetical protein [Patescibacteria group bacterium]
MATNLVIKTPTPEPVDDAPPAISNNNGDGGGFNLVKWIYDFFSLKEPFAFSLIQKYRKKLDLKIEVPWLYYIFLVLCVILDFLFALTVCVVVASLLILITLSFARGIGVFDWLPTLIGHPIKPI